MGTVCTKYDEWAYNPIMDSPSGYVQYFKQNMAYEDLDDC